MLSYGTHSSSGMSFSEHTFAKALAVFPADATTRTRFSSLPILAHMQYASVSLNEQVLMRAPILGLYPLKVM